MALNRCNRRTIILFGTARSCAHRLWYKYNYHTRCCMHTWYLVLLGVDTTVLLGARSDTGVLGVCIQVYVKRTSHDEDPVSSIQYRATSSFLSFYVQYRYVCSIILCNVHRSGGLHLVLQWSYRTCFVAVGVLPVLVFRSRTGKDSTVGV